MKRRARRASAGLTVVELMITLVISSLVAASTFVFFAGQQRIYDTQTKLLNVQQNVWAAMETVTRFVRSGGAGMVGCVRPDPDGIAGPDTGDPPPVGAVAPATGLRAFRGGVAVRIPPLWIINGANGAPDTITVAFGNGTFGNYSDATLNAEMTANEPATDPVRVTADSLPVFRAGEFILLLDTSATPASGNLDRGCSLFQVTGTDVATNTLLRSAASSWNPGANVAGLVPWTMPGPPATSAGIRNFGQLNWVQFSVAPATATEPPRLMMTRLDDATIGAQILAEGIEDLQVAYACDTQPVGVGDGVLTEGTDAATRAVDEWVLNQAGEAVPADCNRPTAIRVTLIARSLTGDDTLADLATNAKPAVEDGAAGARDTFRHRVISTTVFPRN